MRESRTEFNRWRNSQEGQEWKKQKYRQQNKLCPICKETITNLKGSHIDHIKPLVDYPYLALDTDNMQVTHAECNKSKGRKID
ncbi:HNH endonuclease signature motif containing protein [Crocosphaera sp. XPORK-15E]|uniref:HNH endonuclease signature motif containing protein n=1 Tax=Crocosphaera sp. XPORK-15E TaxID=3110247 RepID=UPI002B204D93|nr:HNH endonuclease signature motif containing protein [Crocosphaera sp. XPORK-15E]MEA5533217.1 HNH endonuclease signature motif containing protein [Crocosphaera sp. XPORK-15E]